MEFSFTDLGDVSAYIGVPLTLVASYWLVLPRLTGWNKIYYLYLMSWGVPYIIGNICDSNKIGLQWVQWHLVDLSYEAWSMPLGVVIYAFAMKLRHQACNPRSILMCASISLVVFIAMAYVWEMVQSWLAWRTYGGPIDWSDYIYYAVGAAAATIPLLALKRSRSA